RAAADAPLPGREVHRAAAATARGAAGHHRVGAGAGPRGAAVGGADRARRLVCGAPLAWARPADPRADATRALPRDVQGRDRRLACRLTSCAWRDVAGRAAPLWGGAASAAMRHRAVSEACDR